MFSALKIYLTAAAFNSDIFKEIIDTNAYNLWLRAYSLLREILDALNVKSSEKKNPSIKAGVMHNITPSFKVAHLHPCGMQTFGNEHLHI